MATLRQINSVLGKNFVTKYGTKQGIIVLGRVAPFGPAPQSWPEPETGLVEDR